MEFEKLKHGGACARCAEILLDLEDGQLGPCQNLRMRGVHTPCGISLQTKAILYT